MRESFLYSLGFWVGMLWLLGAMLLVTEIGYRVGRRRGEGKAQERSEISLLQASLLGLLALLIGFTFAMSQSRYEMRRELTVDDANAIGTTYLRAQTLPEPYRGRISNLLRQYVEAELHIYPASGHLDRLRQVRGQVGVLQRQLWAQAAELAAKDRRSVVTGLFLITLNEMIDLHGKRTAALAARVPRSIWQVLVFAAVAAMGLTGYACGRGGSRNWTAVAVLALVIASVTVVIADLDRPVAGPAQISQQALLDVRELMR